jgi:hypothetical protein
MLGDCLSRLRCAIPCLASERQQPNVMLFERVNLDD